MKIELDKRFQKQIRGVIEKYEFQIGMESGTHYEAKKGERGLKGADVVTQYAGGPIRKIDRSKPDGSMLDIAEKFRKSLGVNFWLAPFEFQSSDIIKLMDQFFKYCFGKSEKKRLINTLQAVVRNPLLRGDYGHNSAITQKIKTFDRLGFDTGQFFRNIVADVTVKAVK